MPTTKNKKDQQQQNNDNSTTVDTNRQDNNTKNNKPTAVNEGNPSSAGKVERNNRELHIKHSVLGSDSDGQAD